MQVQHVVRVGNVDGPLSGQDIERIAIPGGLGLTDTVCQQCNHLGVGTSVRARCDVVSVSPRWKNDMNRSSWAPTLHSPPSKRRPSPISPTIQTDPGQRTQCPETGQRAERARARQGFTQKFRVRCYWALFRNHCSFISITFSRGVRWPKELSSGQQFLSSHSAS